MGDLLAPQVSTGTRWLHGGSVWHRSAAAPMAQVWVFPNSPPAPPGSCCSCAITHTRAPLSQESQLGTGSFGRCSVTHPALPEVCPDLLPAWPGHLPLVCAGRHALGASQMLNTKSQRRIIWSLFVKCCLLKCLE